MIDKKVVLIVQARMGSTRLPGKSMMPILGKPLVYRILERLKRCSNVDELVLAIPDSAQDDPLVSIADELDISLFRGSEDNVLLRYYEAALQFDAHYVVRIPADNATPEPFEIDKIIAFHKSFGMPSFSSNLAEVMGSGYPDGIGAEIFDFSLLSDLILNPKNIISHEHVHLNFFDYETGEPVNEKAIPVNTLECPIAYRRPDIVLDVNTSEQFKYISKLYQCLYPRNPEFSIFDIIKWHDSLL